MYRKNSNDLIKHIDFIFIDIVCFLLALCLAFLLKFQRFDFYSDPLYLEMGILIVALTVTFAGLGTNYRGILLRGYLIEIRKTTQHVSLVLAAYLVFSFLTKRAELLSRELMLWFYVCSLILIYIGRCLWKKGVIRIYRATQARKVVLMSDREGAERLLSEFRQRKFLDFTVVGIFLLEEASSDKETKGQQEEESHHKNCAVEGELNADEVIDGFPVVARTFREASDFIEKNIVDELIYIEPAGNTLYAQRILEMAEIMGLTLHMKVNQLERLAGEKTIEEMGGISFVSSCVKLVSFYDVAAKRLMDIAGSLVGLVLTALIGIVIVPMIFLADPGPVFFSQLRVGKNGRRFKMYKFRSMYRNAEEQKKQLMANNDMKQGQMFKMKDDPRVIGSGKDGKTHGIGWFIRTYSLDELPQFWNVLKGDMSLVGTRPPTVEEWETYQTHHRIRMSIRPGMTGLWQISGRSNITDFEEVVRLDTEYIRNWSIWEDLKILLQTVYVVMRQVGAR